MTPPRVALALGERVELGALRRSEDGGQPRFETLAALSDDGDRLQVEFSCVDPEPWATFAARDAPLWQEEVVELFIASRLETPRRYFEIEVNPLGTVFDAQVDSPHGDRRDLRVDASWNCPGLEVEVQTDRDAGRWRARLRIPWLSLSPRRNEEFWRLNLYRIDRPRVGEAEHSAWSPTAVRPADFHRPEQFGFLRRIR